MIGRFPHAIIVGRQINVRYARRDTMPIAQIGSCVEAYVVSWGPVRGESRYQIGPLFCHDVHGTGGQGGGN